VNQIDPHGVSYLLRDVVASKLNKEYEDVPLINQVNSLRAALAPANTQELAVPQRFDEDEDFVEELLA